MPEDTYEGFAERYDTQRGSVLPSVEGKGSSPDCCANTFCVFGQRRDPMRKLFGFAGLLIIFLVLVILGNTFLMTSKQAPAVPAMNIRVDRDRAAQHLSSAVRFQTVSHGDPALDQAGEFSGLHRYLEQTYPAVHRVLTREVVGGSSLLYTWQGRDPALKPILLLAHMDVVPV